MTAWVGCLPYSVVLLGGCVIFIAICFLVKGDES